MARPDRRRPGNAPGALFVDDSCIDCATCRWMAPSTFGSDGGGSIVVEQPRDAAARRRALQALVACPTASIGVEPPDPDTAAAARDFPLPMTPEEDVLHCGHHARSSFGATAYLILRPDGNVLVDSPRFAAPLVQRLEELGGVDWMVLTHRDDVADHAKFAKHFGLRRVLHQADAGKATRDVEVVLEGMDPVDVVPGLRAIPVPGHTAGHVVYLWKDRVLFGGDHLAGNRQGRLVAFRDACWFDWPTQIASMRRLLDVRFAHVLPGHGWPIHQEPGAMHADLRQLIDDMGRATDREPTWD